MATYFISDLHLREDQPQIAQGLLKFLTETTQNADAVYILGDLFEYWIGDDGAQLLGVEPILQAMKKRAQSTQCFFIAGNRDFLVRDGFASSTGFKILDDETVVDLYGTPTLLLHGDSLCTDDVAHQEFRKTMVTNAQWCNEFLAQPIEQRIALAQQARQQSNDHKASVSMSIMDVSETAVLNAFKQHNVTHMIHGHTHRQNIHKYESGDGSQLTRTVLGDWGKTNSVLTVSPETRTLDNTPLTA